MGLFFLATMVVGGFFAWQYVNSQPEEKRKAASWKVVAVVGGVVLLLLVVSGRIHVITAAVAAIIPLLRKLPGLIRYLPWIRKLMGNDGQRHAGQNGSQSQSRQAARGKMDRSQACAILGLKENCTEEEVVAAHRRLMGKVHPDKGGSDYLAAQLNEARDTLLRG